MISGSFNDRGEPTVYGIVVLPYRREVITENVPFLLDTGASRTALHPEDGRKLKVPFGQLENPVPSRGVGGSAYYFVEPAIIYFLDLVADKPLMRAYSIEMLIAEPSEDNETLPSLLGRDITDNWSIQYDPTDSVIACTVRSADVTFGD